MRKKKNARKKKWIVVITLMCVLFATLLLCLGNEKKTQTADVAENIEEIDLSDTFAENENQEEQQENNKNTDSWMEKIINPFKRIVTKTDVRDSVDKNQTDQSQQGNSDKVDSNKKDSDKGSFNKADSSSKDDTDKEAQESPSVNQPSVEDRGELVIREKMDMSYEEALAANAVAAVYMLYPDFEMKGVYLTGETPISNKEDSNGVYVVFEQDGQQMAVHSVSLDDERTKSGTVDVYTIDLGYATFDLVSSNSVDEKTMQKMEMEKLDELIKETLLVTVYEH